MENFFRELAGRDASAPPESAPFHVYNMLCTKILRLHRGVLLAAPEIDDCDFGNCSLFSSVGRLPAGAPPAGAGSRRQPKGRAR